MASSVLKRIEALEAAVIASRHPQLINVWTPSLARRIAEVLPPGHNYELVCCRWPDEETERAFEESLREINPT